METYIIHMAGKTGSQTIQQTLVASVPNCFVERHHFFSDVTISDLRSVCALPDAIPENANSVLSQCLRAEICRNTIISDHAKAKVIISAYRNPYRQSVAAMFQNLPTFLSDFEPNVPATRYVERIIDEFTFVFQNRTKLAQSPNFIDRRKARPIIGFTRWLEDDVNITHGVDVYAQEIDEIGTLRFSKGLTEFLVYKTESLEDNFERIITMIPGVTNYVRTDANRSFEKPYGELYRLFLDQFNLTDEMHSHYYENRFFQHFYE